MARKTGGTRRPRLRLVTQPRPEPSPSGPLYYAILPEGMPEDNDDLLENVTAADGLEAHGIHPDDELICWRGHAIEPGELAAVFRLQGGGQLVVTAGRYYPGPGGYARLEEGRGSQLFRPAEIHYTARVMHVERAGRIIRRF